MARLAAFVALVSVVLVNTVSPAEACAIRCLGLQSGGHETAAPGMERHHHAGMSHVRSVNPFSVSARLCETNCSTEFVARVGRSFLQEKLSYGLNPLLREVVSGTAERDRDAVMHFEVAGPPGPARCGKSILRI